MLPAPFFTGSSSSSLSWEIGAGLFAIMDSLLFLASASLIILAAFFVYFAWYLFGLERELERLRRGPCLKRDGAGRPLYERIGRKKV
jgi:hypothetical protein